MRRDGGSTVGRCSLELAKKPKCGVTSLEEAVAPRSVLPVATGERDHSRNQQ